RLRHLDGRGRPHRRGGGARPAGLARRTRPARPSGAQRTGVPERVRPRQPDRRGRAGRAGRRPRPAGPPRRVRRPPRFSRGVRRGDPRIAGARRYRRGMRVDTNFFGTVPMPDAGDPSIAPTARRYRNPDYLACYENLIHWAQTADSLGFDTIWFTEHHFQYEGYEVTPNLIQFGQWVAGRTQHIRCGQMFNVVPQWHPLRLAEDFAMADILTGGRMEFGVGRGTVPREAWSLGTVVASGDNAMSAEHDRVNRETFEEAMEVIKA